MDNNLEYETQPVNTAQNSNSKKPIIIALCIIIAVAILSIVVAGIFLVAKNTVSHKDIVRALEEGRYSEASSIFEDKYGYGSSDGELAGVLGDRIVALQNDYQAGLITYTSANKEIETIRAMGIASLDDALKQAEEFINNTDVQQNAAVNNSVQTTRKDAPEVNLGSEPLPSVKQSYSSNTPSIVSATTLKGEVLAMSDVNAARSFGANKAIDGYYDSCWCVNTKQTGAAGASIRFDLSGRGTVNGVTIVNGNLYQPYNNLYSKNGQINTFTLTFSDGSTQTFSASFNNASSTPQVIYLDRPVQTDYIILTVQSGHVGSKFPTNVCLGEFGVF